MTDSSPGPRELRLLHSKLHSYVHSALIFTKEEFVTAAEVLCHDPLLTYLVGLDSSGS